jgi:hypothetical protein
MSYQPGQSGNPAGRAVGSRNKLGEVFFDDLLAEWKQRGQAALTELSAETLVKIVARILPREMHVRSENTFAGMSDEELSNVLGEIKRQLVARAGSGSSEGSSAPVSGDKLN